MDMSGMDMGDMDGGSMSMGVGVPNLFDMQKYMWACFGAAIAFATVVNVGQMVQSRHRYVVQEWAKPRQRFMGALSQTPRLAALDLEAMLKRLLGTIPEN
jgi:hypothetical protein